MRKLHSFLMLLLCVTQINAQNIDIRFQVFKDLFPTTEYDRIVVTNLFNGKTIVLTYPDTLLSNYNVGIAEPATPIQNFELKQNFPNPYSNETNVMLTVPKTGEVTLILTNILGQVKYKKSFFLGAGEHQFSVQTSEPGVHILTATSDNETSSVKMMQNVATGAITSISHQMIFSPDLPQIAPKSAKTYFDFKRGEQFEITPWINGEEGAPRYHIINKSGSIALLWNQEEDWSGYILTSLKGSSWEVGLGHAKNIGTAIFHPFDHIAMDGEVHFGDSTFVSYLYSWVSQYDSWPWMTKEGCLGKYQVYYNPASERYILRVWNPYDPVGVVDYHIIAYGCNAFSLFYAPFVGISYCRRMLNYKN